MSDGIQIQETKLRPVDPDEDKVKINLSFAGTVLASFLLWLGISMAFSWLYTLTEQWMNKR